MDVDIDLIYDFKLEKQTLIDYKCLSKIIRWLQINMDSLKDDNDNKLFSRVSTGYNENTLKGFGKKPVCDVYIDHLNYKSDLDSNKPDAVTSFIICYLKGNMNNSYEKACEITDYIIQEFSEEQNFRELESIVRTTFIRNVELQIIPGNKAYGVLCAFELEHKLY